MEKMKKALVFSGGGALGAYEVGVWSVLDRHSYCPDFVLGTSVGSLNAALYAQGSYETAYTMWHRITTDNVLSISAKSGENIPDFLEKLNVMTAIGRESLIHKGADAAPLRRLIDTYIDENAIRNSSIKFGLSCVQLNQLRGVYKTIDEMVQGSLTDWLMASCALVPAMQPVSINEETYIDGGFYDNTPVSFAESLGAEEILAVELYAPGIRRNAERAQVVTIGPEWDLGSMLFFSPSHTAWLFQLGKLDAMKFYGEYSGVLYAFTNDFGSVAEKTAHIAHEKLHQLSPQHNNPLSKGTYSALARRTSVHLKKLYKHHDGHVHDVHIRLAENAGRVFNLDPVIAYTPMEFNAQIARCAVLRSNKPSQVAEILRSDFSGKEKFIEILETLKTSPSAELAAAFTSVLQSGFKSEIEKNGMRILGAAFPAEFLAALYAVSLT